jgi:hypothetical protein
MKRLFTLVSFVGLVGCAADPSPPANDPPPCVRPTGASAQGNKVWQDDWLAPSSMGTPHSECTTSDDVQPLDGEVGLADGEERSRGRVIFGSPAD